MYSAHDISTMKGVYKSVEMAEGLQMDKHILDIKEVQLQVGAEGCGEV